MAQVGGDSDGPNVELNLVPFIDLMCVCITFLLVTAVWTQVSMIQIGSSIYGKRSSENEVTPPPQNDIPFRIDIVQSGYRATLGGRVTNIPLAGSEHNQQALGQYLGQVKRAYPDKNDVVVMMADHLSYEKLVEGMDVMLASGFPDIGISTGGAQ